MPTTTQSRLRSLGAHHLRRAHAAGDDEVVAEVAEVADALSGLLDSPLAPLHEAYVGGEVAWEEWAGYKTATYLGDVGEELKRVRTGAVMFDMSPVVKYRIVGPDACKFLNLLTTRQMDIAPGRVRYTCWCNAAGKIIDDGTCFRVSEEEYILFPGDLHPEHFGAVAAGLDVVVADMTSELAALTVQGKASLTAVQALAGPELALLKPFSFRDYDTPAGTFRISRTGFFGDLGYELWFEPSQGEAVWNLLLEAGALPVGMTCLENARLEGGLLIPGEGFDFVPAGTEGAAAHPENRSPFEVDLGFLVSFKKEEAYIGRPALEAEAAEGSTWQLIGLEFTIGAVAVPANGDVVKAAAGSGEAVGFVTSGLYSPSLQRTIALASVRTAAMRAAAAPAAGVGMEFVVSVDGGDVSAVGVEKPFIAPERKGLTPAPAL
jgi:aminomethyltransferase